MEWVVEIFHSSDENAMTISTFFLGYKGGRSSMNRMELVSVSFVVPSMTLFALLCTRPNFSRFVCGVVMNPNFDAAGKGGVA